MDPGFHAAYGPWGKWPHGDTRAIMGCPWEPRGNANVIPGEFPWEPKGRSHGIPAGALWIGALAPFDAGPFGPWALWTRVPRDPKRGPSGFFQGFRETRVRAGLRTNFTHDIDTIISNKGKQFFSNSDGHGEHQLKKSSPFMGSHQFFIDF